MRSLFLKPPADYSSWMSDSSPQLVVVAGPNGAGKSTLAPDLLSGEYQLSEYVNADRIALGLSGLVAQNTAMEAGRVMINRMRNLAKARASFAFETTMASRSFAPWISGLAKSGYSVHIVYVWLRTPELAVQRVEERVRAGGHSVEAEVVKRRYERGIANFFNLYRSMARTWAVYDNSSGGNPILVAERSGENGAERVHSQDLWARFCQTRK